MGNRVLRLGLLAAFLVVVLVGVGTAVNAQRGMAECNNPTFDLDGSGAVAANDLNTWKVTFKDSGCELGGPVTPQGCSPSLDMNGDDLASRADLDSFISVVRACTDFNVQPGS